MAKKQASADVGFFTRYMKGRKAMQVETGLRLFVAAGEFLQRAPWKLLENEDLLLWRTETEQYCLSVMGAAEQVFGVQVLRTPMGSSFLQRVLDDDLTAEDATQLQDGFWVQYSPWSELEKADKQYLEECGHPGGKKAIGPQFREVRPSRFPWYFDEAAGQVAVRFFNEFNLFYDRVLKVNPDSVRPRGEELMEYRVVDGEVRCSFVVPPDYEPEEEPLPQLDGPRLEKLLARKLARGAAMEVNYAYTMVPIGKEGEAPQFGRTTIAVDSASGMVLQPGMHDSLTAPGQALVETTLGGIEHSQRMPSEIHVNSAEYARLLTPLGMLLGVPVLVRDELPALEEAEQAMMQFLERRP